MRLWMCRLTGRLSVIPRHFLCSYKVASSQIADLCKCYRTFTFWKTRMKVPNLIPTNFWLDLVAFLNKFDLIKIIQKTWIRKNSNVNNIMCLDFMLGGHVSFYTPCLDIWCCLLWVSKPEWAASFALCGCICDVHSLTFTSGATPADFLVASMAVKPFSFTYLPAVIGGGFKTGIYCVAASRCETRQTD